MQVITLVQLKKNIKILFIIKWNLLHQTTSLNNLHLVMMIIYKYNKVDSKISRGIISRDQHRKEREILYFKIIMRMRSKTIHLIKVRKVLNLQES